MEKKIYLPINSNCLSHYFGSACIMPSRYFNNKPPDIQDKFADYLLITNSLGTQESDCCLELILTNSELNEIISIEDGFALYPKALPISRVKSVIFSNEKQKEQTIININMSTAFVPENIIQVIPEFEKKSTINLKKPLNIEVKDWSLEINKFNSLLGGFSLLRLSGDDYMNYSENYFSSLATFNLTIESELLNSGKSFKNLFNDNLFKEIQPLLKKNIGERDLDQIAKKENQIIKKDYLSNIDLNSLNDATYVIAILNHYGVGGESKKKKIDELILSNFKSGIKNDQSSLIALCYGLNRGYFVFNNKYKSGNTEKKIKFELNSQLDYYTIECLYLYSFNLQVKSEAFPYLDSWCPRFENNINIKKNYYQILDVLVTGKRKPKVNSQEYLTNLLHFFFQKDKEELFRDLFEKIRTIIFNDTSEELKEEISFRDIEIERLKYEEAKVSKLEAEIGRLNYAVAKVSKLEAEMERIMNENQNENIESKKDLSKIVSKNVSLHQAIDKKILVKEVLSLKEKNKVTLEKLAQEKGINIPKGTKLDDIIVLIMTQPGNNRSEIPF